MKSLLELYTLLLENFKERNEGFVNISNNFICNSIKNLFELGKITKIEKALLSDHFKKEKPSSKKHIEFFEHDLFFGCGAWFNTVRNTELSYALRVQLLTNIISKLKECQ